MPPTLCSLLTVGLILWLTLAPQPMGELEVPLFPGADKAVHAIMFGFLTWMLYIDSGKVRHHVPSARTTLLCAICSTLFGFLIEWLQKAMAMGRSPEVADMFADASGALVALILILSLRHRLPPLKY